MSKFSAAYRHAVLVTVLVVASGCDGEPGAGDAAAGGTGGVRDAPADAPGGSGGDASSAIRDAALEAPAQDLTPVMIERPEVVRAGTRLRGFFVQSAGVAQERWALWDTMLNTRCALTTADDGKVRCLPILPSAWALDSWAGRFIDADCTTYALPEAPACASGFGFKLLPAGRAIHRLGPAAEVTTVYTRSVVNGAVMCQARTLPQPQRFFTLGEQLPATSFVERMGSRSDGPQAQRMQPVYSEMADGTRMLTSLTEAWDSDLETYCRVWTADDGWLRCLPNPVMTASTFTFSDDKCTRSAGQSLAASTPEKFAILYEGTGCQTRRRVFRVAMPATPLTMVYRVLNERCVASPQGTGSSGYFALGEELPAARFAAFRPARVGSGGRLQERYFVGEEGVAVRELNGLWDSQLNQLCTFELTTSGRRCVPPGWGGYFGDTGCTSRVGVPGSPPCGEPTAATPMNSLNVGPWCAPQSAPHALTTANAPDAGSSSAFVYSRSADNSCSGVNFLSTGWRGLGDPVALDMFAPGTEAMD